MRKEKGSVFLRLEEKVQSTRVEKYSGEREKGVQVLVVNCPCLPGPRTHSQFLSHYICIDPSCMYHNMCNQIPCFEEHWKWARMLVDAVCLVLGPFSARSRRKRYSNAYLTLVVCSSIHPCSEFWNLKNSEGIFTENFIGDFY